MRKKMVCNRSFQLLFVMFIITAIISPAAYSQYVIDDFESGVGVHLSVVDYQGGDSFSEAGLPVLSGKRKISVNNWYNPAGTVTSADLDSTAGDDALVVSGSKAVADKRGSSAAIWYRDHDDEMSFDMTLHGDRFYLIFSDDPGVDVRMSISLVSQGVSISGPGRWDLDGGGYYEILFSGYTDYSPGFDLTDISGLGLHVSFRGSHQEVAITEWGIVPEPATLAMLGLGGLLIRKKQRE
ncbi:MAG: PEP-CTERM sorting domain-containing protein [Planctomycetes bacterium]|nr:PEP-CTERM sorting domain-containing protein [Planctomycetota bacterium]